MKGCLSLAAMLLALSACGKSEEEQNKIAQANLEQEAREALDGKSRDPLNMQVRKVSAKSNKTLCGEVNLKNDSGQYMGFELFRVDRTTGEATIIYPSTIGTQDDEAILATCADDKQLRIFRERKKQSSAEMNLDLAKMNRENRVKLLEAELRLGEATGQAPLQPKTTNDRDAPTASSWTAAEQRLISDQKKANEQCRGGSGDDPKTEVACQQRDILDRKMRSNGICYGKDDQAGYEMDYHRCGANSL